MSKQMMTLGMRGISNSQDITKIPDGFWFSGVNATFRNGIIEGGVRYRTPWARPGAHAGDIGYGCFYAEYEALSETLSVIKRNGDTRARLMKLDTVTGTWTDIVYGTSQDLDPSRWIFAQFEGWVYAANAVDGIFRHKIGETVSATAWERLPAVFEFGGDLGAARSKPPYPVRAYVNADQLSGSADGDHSWDRVIALDSQTIELRENAAPFFIPDDEYANHVVDIGFASPLPMTNGEYIGFWMDSVSCELDDPITVEISSDPWGGSWTVTSCPVRFIETIPATGSSAWGVRVYLPPGHRGGAINKMRISFGAQAFGNGSAAISISAFTLGGADIPGMGDSAPEYLAPAVEYAFCYAKTDGSLTPATQVTLSDGLAQGVAMARNAGPLGSEVKLTPVANSTYRTSGYTQIRLFRKQRVGMAAGTWRQIGILDNTDDGAAVGVLDIFTETMVDSLPSATLDTSGFSLDFKPTTITVWKGHTVLGNDRKVYLSRAGSPTNYLPPPEVDYIPPDSDDESRGRTLYASSSRSEPIRALVAEDALYLCGSRASYVMIGDSAGSAAQPRVMPGARPPVSQKGAIGYAGGALIGAIDGLWLYIASRADTGTNEAIYRSQELTSGVRASWRRLLGTAPEKLVLAYFYDEIWAFCETRFMRLTPPDQAGDRSWEEGNFPEVFDISWHPAVGAIAQLANGTLTRVGFSTNMAPYSTDPVDANLPFSVASSRFLLPRSRVTGIRIIGDGTPTVEIRSTDGVKGQQTATYTKDSTRVWVKNVNIQPGFAFEITISGVLQRDTIQEIGLILEDSGEGFGN